MVGGGVVLLILVLDLSKDRGFILMFISNIGFYFQSLLHVDNNIRNLEPVSL